MYKKVAESSNDPYHFEMGRSLAERLGYNSNILDILPQESINSFAGVGHYFDFAQLIEGEKVVDFGSGSGMDAFFAAKQVGKNGNVIGLDMTDEQLEKSYQLKLKNNIDNVDFIKGYIETPPLKSNIIVKKITLIPLEIKTLAFRVISFITNQNMELSTQIL